MVRQGLDRLIQIGQIKNSALVIDSGYVASEPEKGNTTPGASRFVAQNEDNCFKQTTVHSKMKEAPGAVAVLTKATQIRTEEINKTKRSQVWLQA